MTCVEPDGPVVGVKENASPKLPNPGVADVHAVEEVTVNVSETVHGDVKHTGAVNDDVVGLAEIVAETSTSGVPVPPAEPQATAV